jgi:hypothetical protein
MQPTMVKSFVGSTVNIQRLELAPSRVHVLPFLPRSR